MEGPSRRSFLAGALGIAGLAAAGALSGCAPSVSVSANPDVLTLWYWNLSIADSLLAKARRRIPGTDRRLEVDKIGGNFDVKLRTSLAGRAFIPDVSALNSNVNTYFPLEDQFVDMNELGADRYRDQYLDWKLALGVTSTGRQCFWPMDTGPTALWYRRDIWDKAGLDGDPDAVTAAMTDWDAWIETGKQLRKNTNASIIISAQQAYNAVLGASAERYFAKDGTRLYDKEGSAVRKAWDVAVKASRAHVTQKAYTDTEKNSSLSAGHTVSNVEAVWWGPQLQAAAPHQSGKWGVAHQPGPPGNNGGSFLTIPKTSKDPEAAFALITWLTSPENQVVTYEESQLFPSTPDSFRSIKPDAPNKFCGGQPITQTFVEAAKEVPTTFISPYESAVGDGINLQLTNIETQGKDPDRAWDDAMAQADRQLKKKGLI
ncbi:extracellular solute-binding protein [Luteimicrobium sp. DT211]|uniref:ABC transporter substrate-binding protein n=1 Tax=Luteimicrobium sp. DT211 TaxID=3393412 RepID=UPI003CEECD9A